MRGSIQLWTKVTAFAAFTVMIMFLFHIGTHLHNETPTDGVIKSPSKVKSVKTPFVDLSQAGPKAPPGQPNDGLGAKETNLNSNSNSNSNAIHEHEHQTATHQEVKESIQPLLIRGATVAQPTHPILYLSEADYKTTSVAEHMSKYGEALGGGTCAGDFGNTLVNRWRDTKQETCSPVTTAGDSKCLAST